jgi:hypothetical protein
MPIEQRSVVFRFPASISSWVALVALASSLCASEAGAQTTDAIGVRAQGLAGAFTAVADDASAGFWNPAGLAGGPFVNGLVEYGKPDRSTDETVRGFTAAYPALGVTYYRLPLSQIRVQTSTGADLASRKDQGNLSLYGVTVGHSIGDHLVLGTTLKLLRAGDTAADVDAGAMVTFGPARIGATVRNLSEPSFGSDASGFKLQRHARAGFALSSGRRGIVGSATVAIDADLTRESTGRGDERFIAVGAEAWAPKQTVGIRGGFSHNSVGAGDTMLSGGFSLAVRQSTFVDVYVSTGDESRHGWGVGFRVTF